MTGRKETTLAVILTVTALAAVPVLITPAAPAVTALHLLALAAVLGACWTAINEDTGGVVGVALIGLAWLLPTFAEWAPLGPYPRALLLAAPPLAVAGVAVLLGGRRPAPILLACAAVAAHALTYDPFYDASCDRTCLAAPTPLSTVADTRTATALVTALTLAAAVLAVRQTRPPLVWTAGAATAALTVATAATGVDLLPAAGTAVTGAAMLTETIRVQRIRRRVRGAVAQLAGATPGIAAHFCVPGDGRWVDSAGRPVPNDGGPAAILLDRDTPAVRLLLTSYADPARTLAALTPAGRLALHNARLRAAGAFQLGEIQASQRRIVQTADAERRRIERDLHDGAQQRLVAVAMHLGSARPQADTATAEAIAAAAHHVRQALAALRAQSSESSSEVLATEGLTAAIEDLTDRAAVDVDLHVALTGATITWPAQRAAVAVVVEGLDNAARHARTGQASVDVADDGAELRIRITDNGPGGAFPGPGLTALADRAGALGGQFQLLSPTGAGTTIVVTLPCA